jgi:acyl-CoA thioesterase-1
MRNTQAARLGTVAALACIAGIVWSVRAAVNDDGRRMLPPPRTSDMVYVALGDSTVAGIGATSAATNYASRIVARLRDVYGTARLVNLGVPGAVASDVVAGQLDRAVALRPALVTLSIGPNDVTSGVAAADYARNVDRIFRTLREQTSAVVVVNLLPDLALTPRFARSPLRDEVGRRAHELNGLLATAAERFGVEIVDLYTRSRQEVQQHPELFAVDGYHPSDAGYARWAAAMWEGIARRLPAAASAAANDRALPGGRTPRNVPSPRNGTMNGR